MGKFVTIASQNIRVYDVTIISIFQNTISSPFIERTVVAKSLATPVDF